MHEVSRVKCPRGSAIRVIEEKDEHEADVVRITIAGPLDRRGRWLSKWITAAWVEDALLATQKVQLSFTGHLVTNVRYEDLLETIEQLASTYYGEDGRINEMGAKVLARCWRMVGDDIDVERFTSIPESAWLWLDLITRDDCAECARMADVWGEHIIVDAEYYLERNLKALYQLWFKEVPDLIRR